MSLVPWWYFERGGAVVLSPQEQLDRPTLQALQRERLGWTVRHAYDHVPFYRGLLDGAGVDPLAETLPEDLASLPFTRKGDLRDQYPFGLFAVPRSDVLRVHASSGTRGKPTVVGYTRGDLEVWAECCARSLALAGAQPGDLLHNAYGYGLFTGGLGLHQGAERLGLTVVPASGGATQRQVQLLADFQADGIACTPSYLLNIADAIDASGLPRSAFRLRYAVLGAEPWTESMRRQIEQRLGVDAIDIYGLSEVIGPGVGCECREEKDGLHLMEDHFLVEVVDPETGEVLEDGTVGELVFTSLTKEAFPILRYRSGDLASIDRRPCSCGRTTARMSRIKGRTDDMLIIRGVNVFPSEIEAVLLRQPDIAPHYEVVIYRARNLDVLEVRAELTTEFVQRHRVDSEFARLLASRAAEAIRGEIGVAVEVQLMAPHSVPRSEGKARRVQDLRNA